jgi:hypothetical protein
VIALVVLLVAGLVLLMRPISPYRTQRLLAFLDPWAETPYGKGYQLTQSLIAFGSRRDGSAVGLGASVAEAASTCLRRTPTSCSPVIAEELGFVGVPGDHRRCSLALRLARRLRIGAPGHRGDRREVRGAHVARASASGSRIQAVHQHGREHGRAAHQGPARCRS